MNTRIDWIDDGDSVGVGAPVLVKQGHTYEGRLLIEMPCSQIPPAVISGLRASLEQQFDFVRLLRGSSNRPIADWPSDRVDFPHDSTTQCLMWISGAYKFPDTSWELDTLTPPGVRLLDMWDQTDGQMLVDNTSGFKLPRTPPVSGIPNIPFPLPQIPGASPALLLRAIDALSKAGAACPQLATVGGPLQHAATAFAAFAALSISLGGDGSENLAALEQQLDALCPTWRSTSPSAPVPMPGPALPAASGDVATILTRLTVALTAGAFQQLPDLATQATSIGLPLLAQEINRFAAQHTGGTPGEPPGPPPDAQPPGEPPSVPPTEEAPKKKKSNMGLVLGAAALVGVAVVVTALS